MQLGFVRENQDTVVLAAVCTERHVVFSEFVVRVDFSCERLSFDGFGFFRGTRYVLIHVLGCVVSHHKPHDCCTDAL